MPEDEPYNIQMGVKFYPFKDSHELLKHSPGSQPFRIRDCYPHKVYIRRQVSLMGIEGVIDLVDLNAVEEVSSILMTAASHRQVFMDHPFGQSLPSTPRPDLQFRFSFLLRNPGDYSKLLTTDGFANIGRDKFFFGFNLNEQTTKQKMKRLESGYPTVVTEYNLFNLRTVRRLGKELDKELNGGLPEEKPVLDVPRKAAFVYLLPNLNRIRRVGVQFVRFGGWGKDERAVSPRPSSEVLQSLVPILV